MFMSNSFGKKTVNYVMVDAYKMYNIAMGKQLCTCDYTNRNRIRQVMIFPSSEFPLSTA